jgi:hypothetical protein
MSSHQGRVSEGDSSIKERLMEVTETLNEYIQRSQLHQGGIERVRGETTIRVHRQEWMTE